MKTRPLRIAMLSLHSSPIGELGTHDTGGMSVYVRELSAELGSLGHRVDIFTGVGRNGTRPVLELAPNVRLVHLKLGINGNRIGLFPHLSRYFAVLETFRKREETGYDLVHSHYWLSGRIGSWAQSRWRVPHVVMFHTLGALKNAADCGEDEPGLRVAEETEIARGCNRIVAPTAREREEVIRHCGVDPDRIAVVPCGVNLGHFRPMDPAEARSRLGIRADEPLLLYVGRFAPVKGVPRLLEALARSEHCPRPRLLVVGGDGPGAGALEALRQLARALGVADRVTFAGRVEQGALPPYYAAADLLAVPSHYESFGLVALEALACGTRVVASAVGAMDEVLSQGGGELVTDPSAEALARALDRVLSLGPPAPCERLRLRRTVERYAWPRVAEAILQEYEGLVGRADPQAIGER